MQRATPAAVPADAARPWHKALDFQKKCTFGTQPAIRAADAVPPIATRGEGTISLIDDGSGGQVRCCGRRLKIDAGRSIAENPSLSG
jgi:hypothetical protein